MCERVNSTPLPFFFKQRNNISSLPSSLTNTTDLRWLILDHNRLQSDKLDLAALQSQTQMCYFFANHNNLKSVPNTLPAALQELRLAHNRVSSISPGTFRNMPKLRLLLLQGNRLQTITGGDLKGCVMHHFLLHAARVALPGDGTTEKGPGGERTISQTI